MKLVNGFERVLLIPDSHLPYEHKIAFKLLLSTIESWKPHRLIILGDFMDMKSVTGHGLKPKERALMLHDELAYTRRMLEKIRGLAPSARIYYIGGNHEDRLDRYISKNAPALDDVFELSSELDFGGLDIDYTPYKDYLTIDKMHFTHDLGQAGVNAHRSARVATHGNIVIGHTHRMGVEYGASLNGTHVSANFGWLGSEEADADYVHKLKQKASTVLGFGVAFRHAESKLWWLTAVPILKKSVCLPTEPMFIKSR